MSTPRIQEISLTSVTIAEAATSVKTFSTNTFFFLWFILMIAVHDSKMPNKLLSVGNDSGALFQNHTNNTKVCIFCDICLAAVRHGDKEKTQIAIYKRNPVSGATTGGEGECLGLSVYTLWKMVDVPAQENPARTHNERTEDAVHQVVEQDIKKDLLLLFKQVV